MYTSPKPNFILKLMRRNILLKVSILFCFLFSVFPAKGQAELELAKAKLLAQKPKEAITILWRTAYDTAQIQDFFVVMAFAQAAFIQVDSIWPAGQLDSCRHYFHLAEQIPAKKLNQKNTRDLLLRLRIEKERIFRVAYNLSRTQQSEELAEKIVHFFPENEKALTLFLKRSTKDSLRFVYGMHKAHTYGLTLAEWPLLLRLSFQHAKDTSLTRKLLREAVIYHPNKIDWAEDYAALAFAQKDTLEGVNFLWPRSSDFLTHFLIAKKAYYSLEKYFSSQKKKAVPALQEQLAATQLRQLRELLLRLKNKPEEYTYLAPFILKQCDFVQSKLKPFSRLQTAVAALKETEEQLNALLKSKAFKALGNPELRALPTQHLSFGETFIIQKNWQMVKVNDFLHFPDSSGKITLRFYSPEPDTLKLTYFRQDEKATQKLILNGQKEEVKTPLPTRETAIYYTLPEDEQPDSIANALGTALLKHFPEAKLHFAQLPDTLPQKTARVIVVNFQDTLPEYPDWVFSGKAPLLFLQATLPSLFVFRSTQKNMELQWFYPQAFSACYGLQASSPEQLAKSLNGLPPTGVPLQLYLLLKPHLPALKLYEASSPLHEGGKF